MSCKLQVEACVVKLALRPAALTCSEYFLLSLANNSSLAPASALSLSLSLSLSANTRRRLSLWSSAAFKPTIRPSKHVSQAKA